MYQYVFFGGAMNRYTPGFLDEVKARTDLARLIGDRVKLAKNGPEYTGLCPFHAEKTPSFTVRPDKGFYHCFGCGAHGDAIAWMVRGLGLSFDEGVRALASRAGMDVPDAEAARRKADAAPGPVAPRVINADPEAEARAAARKREIAFALWSGGGPIAGSLAEVYLAEARGIPVHAFRGSAVLRFLPDLEYRDDDRRTVLHVGPAMIAALQAPDGRFAALHMTYLAADGFGKLRLPNRKKNGDLYPAKKVLGDPKGAAIRLFRPAVRMGAGEGIETCLSVGAVGLPAWAAYSLDNLAGRGLGQGMPHPDFPGKFLPSEVPDPDHPGMALPAGCARVTYLGDGDTKDLKMLECKLRRACRRAEDSGRMADYVITPRGTDFNDLLRGRL